jgi:hypothetical protein
MSKTVIASGGISITTLLAVLFVALKLLNRIDWSWGWVLAPLWIPWAAVVAVILICFMFAFFGKLID